MFKTRAGGGVKGRLNNVKKRRFGSVGRPLGWFKRFGLGAFLFIFKLFSIISLSFSILPFKDNLPTANVNSYFNLSLYFQGSHIICQF